jgi:hypothetical protein
MTAGLGPLIVGAEKELVFSSVTFENSYERENIGHIINEAYRDWPDVMSGVGPH